MAAVGRVDDLVKEYLLYRGFSATLRSLDTDLKVEKDKGFRVDKILDLLTAAINNYDLGTLRDYWRYLDRRIFSRLEYVYNSSVSKLEMSLYKMYIVNAYQNNKPDKVVEFFETMTPELQSQAEWKDWFVFPFIKNPEENRIFAMYFTKQWQETLLISLHNFLSVIFQCMPVPALLSFEEDQKRIKQLKEENETYKLQLESCGKMDSEMKIRKEKSSPVGPVAGSMDLMDDFYVISQDTTIEEREQPARAQQIRTFIKNIGLPSSPITGKKTPNLNSTKKGQASPLMTENAKEETISQGVKVRQRDSRPRVVRPSGGVVSGNGTNTPTNQATANPGSGAMAALETKSNEAKPIDNGDKVVMREKKASSQPAGDSQTPRLAAEKEKASGIPVNISNHQNSTSKGENGKDSTGRVSQLPVRSPPDGTSRKDIPSSFVQPAPQVTGASSISVDANEKGSAFILLSQEEYGEHRSSITHCKFSSTGHMVATSDVDGVVKVWTLQPSPVTIATVMSKAMLLSLEWAPKTDRLLLLGNKAGNVRIFDVKEKKILKEASVDPAFPRIVSICASPSGTSFVCSSAGKLRTASAGNLENNSLRVGKLSLWDIKTFKVEKNLPLANLPPSVAINCTTFNHNGTVLMTGASDGVVRLFDINKCECIASWTAHNGEVYSVEFSRDETSCFSMGSDSKFIQWSMHKTGKKLADLGIHAGACGPFVLTGAGGYRQVQTPKGKLFAFDSNGQHVLSCANGGGMIYKINKDTGLQKSIMLGGHKTPVTCVDWSASEDCKMCLTGSMDGKIRVSTLLNQ